MSEPVPPGEKPPWQSRHLWEIQPVRDTMLIAATLGLVYGGYVLGTVTVPMLVALGFAYLVEPLVARVTKTFPRLGRRAVVAALLALTVLLLSLGLAIAIPVVAAQAEQLKDNAPRYASSLRKLLEESNVPDWARGAVQPVIELLPKPEEEPATSKIRAPLSAQKNPIVPPAVSKELTEARIREIVRDELSKPNAQPESGDFAGFASRGLAALVLLGRIAGSLATLVFFLAVSAICFFYFSSSFPNIQLFGKSLLPEANKDRLLDLINKMDAAISAFVRGRLLISIILTLLYIAGWSIMGVPHAILLGVFAGACSIVPYLAWTALPIAWILLAVTLPNSPYTGLYFEQPLEAGGALQIVWWKVFVCPLIVTITVQLVEDYVLTPTIQGQATNLHPLTISLAVIAGGSLAGLYGMLLAIPFAACVKIAINELVMPQFQAWLKGETQDPIPM